MMSSIFVCAIIITILLAYSFEFSYVQVNNQSNLDSNLDIPSSVGSYPLGLISELSPETNVASCDSFVWNGSIYKESGIFTKNLLSVSGEDSLATLNLTINESYTNKDTVYWCDSYKWQGKT